MTKTRAFVLLVGLSACYSPNLTSGSFRCAADGVCPAGMSCDSSGICVTGGGTSPDLAMSTGGPPDLSSGMTGQKDLAQGHDLTQGHDLAQRDLGSPAQDLSMQGCLNGGGVQVGKAGKDVLACPGPFSGISQAQLLCNGGYTMCNNGDNIDEPGCDGKVVGFFMINALLSYSYNGSGISQVKCDSSSGDVKALLGCGPVTTSMLPGGGCKALNTQIACNGSSSQGLSGWSCNNSSQDAVNTSSTGGVLCCR